MLDLDFRVGQKETAELFGGATKTSLPEAVRVASDENCVEKHEL